MTSVLTRLFGRLPIGWLQLIHNRARLAAALAGVAFANILIFIQLGFLGALIESIKLPYALMNAELIISASDANTLQDGSPLPRQRLFQALAVPGVIDATPLYYNRLDWKQDDGTIRNLDVFGVDPSAAAFRSPEIIDAMGDIQRSDVAILDRKTRNVDKKLLRSISETTPYTFEANNRTVTVTRTFEIGGGFTADGFMIVSDQTFLRLFQSRAAGAPNHILLKLKPGANIPATVSLLRQVLPSSDSQVRTVSEAVSSDQRFQTTQKPIGIIFGFGAFIGTLVGIIVVYQVLSTDVADHLKEYATFKAVGYKQSFFLGIVFEEALILALFGFIPGIAVTLCLYWLISFGTGLPVAMTLTRAVLVLVGTLAMCTFSGAIATRRLSSADPAELF